MSTHLVIHVPEDVTDHFAKLAPNLHPDFTVPFLDFQGLWIPAKEIAVLTHIAFAKAVERQYAYVQPVESWVLDFLSDSWKRNLLSSPAVLQAFGEGEVFDHLRMQFYASMLHPEWTYKIATQLEEGRTTPRAYLIERYGCRPIYLA